MYKGLLDLHNVLRWAILILLVIALLQAFAKKPGIRKSSLWLMICAHVTLLIGLYQWFTGTYGLKVIQEAGFGAVMKDAASRFWAVEHISGMLIAIILITIARSKAKVLNYQVAAWLYLIALIILLVTIPWPFREGIGRPWLPGMN
jgi:glucan phosphoethanolaminetransferase (alkaline phosphatase superfamily)